MPGFILLHSAVVLALNQPVTLKAEGVVWISAKDNARLQSLPGKITLNPIKLGQFYASGADFGARGLSDPVKVLVTTAINFSALEVCPYKSHFELGAEEIIFTGASDADLAGPCRFDRLGFGERDVPANFLRAFLAGEAKLRGASLPRANARWMNGRRVLQVTSADEAERAQKILPATLLPFYEFEVHSSVSPGRNLIFELTLFEYSRDKAKNLGIKWPKSISLFSVDSRGKAALKLLDGRASNRQGDGRTPSVGDDEILLATDFGESQGVGKVLAQPTLRTKPGVESRFLSGGEFPIRNSNAFHSETVWKSYGLKVSLTPDAQTETGDREVSVDFKMEFSEPNPDMGIDGIPGIIDRQLESHFDVRLNELTVLTTMVTLRENKARDGLYFFSQLPVLSLLFGQRADRKNNSELWFALRPTWDEIPADAAKNRDVSLEDSL